AEGAQRARYWLLPTRKTRGRQSSQGRPAAAERDRPPPPATSLPRTSSPPAPSCRLQAFRTVCFRQSRFLHSPHSACSTVTTDARAAHHAGSSAPSSAVAAPPHVVKIRLTGPNEWL